MYICAYCGETYLDNNSYSHTEDECKDILIEKIDKQLKNLCLYNLKRLYNFVLSLN